MSERDPAVPPPGDEEHRFSRRSLLRGQLLRWATGVAVEVAPSAPAPSVPVRMTVAQEQATAQVRSVWDRAGHEPLLRALEPVAERVVGRAQFASGDQVLDVGAGDGNVALAAWRRGAIVTACDLAPAMVEQGKVRCPQATWSLADVQDLPFVDGAFDKVLSAFGATLAPDPLLAADELVRVTCPGGLVVLAAWLPHEPLAVLEPFADPEGAFDPTDWGREDVVRARFDGLLDQLEFETATVPLPGPGADDVDVGYLLIRGRRPIPPM